MKILNIGAKQWYEDAMMHEPSIKAGIERVLKTAGRISGQGLVYHAQGSGAVLMSAETCAFCAYSLRHAVTGDFCRYACLGAAMQALASGEPHYQRCWAGLLYVTVAVAPRGIYRGGLSSGGFRAEGEEADIRDSVAERLSAVPRADPGPFLARLCSLRAISPSALRGLGLFLMESTFSGGVNDSGAVQKQHARYEHQRRIAEAYATIRHSGVEPPDVLGDAYRLVAYFNRRDRDGAMQFISGHLARLLLVSRWNLTKLRAHVRVLLAVITSQDVLDGMAWAAATSRELMTMARIEKADTVEGICSEVADLVLEHFGRHEAVAGDAPRLAERVSVWLQGHYHEPATLREAARAVGASVSAISHQLPRETGKSYRQLRMDLRMTEARRLLATTGRSLGEIAEACGFTDQSHFTRHFRREVNLTPGRFRALLKLDADLVRSLDQ